MFDKVHLKGFATMGLQKQRICKNSWKAFLHIRLSQNDRFAILFFAVEFEEFTNTLLPTH